MHNRSKSKIVIALSGLWLGVACQWSNPAGDGLVDIYSIIVDSLRPGGGSGAMLLLDTVHLGLLSDYQLDRLGADADLKIAYFVADQRRDAPVTLLSEGLGIEVFDRRRFQLAPEEDPAKWWDRVTDYYGTTEIVLVHFGFPGVSSDETQAVLNYEVSCGIQCRSWHAARLARLNGSWSLTSHFMYAIN